MVILKTLSARTFKTFYYIFLHVPNEIPCLSIILFPKNAVRTTFVKRFSCFFVQKFIHIFHIKLLVKIILRLVTNCDYLCYQHNQKIFNLKFRCPRARYVHKSVNIVQIMTIPEH